MPSAATNSSLCPRLDRTASEWWFSVLDSSMPPVQGLTIVDSLDSLLIFGQDAEFAKVPCMTLLRQLFRLPACMPACLHALCAGSPVDRAESARRQPGKWPMQLDCARRQVEQEDINLFETTIRVIGGLLSTYALTEATHCLPACLAGWLAGWPAKRFTGCGGGRMCRTRCSRRRHSASPTP